MLERSKGLILAIYIWSVYLKRLQSTDTVRKDDYGEKLSIIEELAWKKALHLACNISQIDEEVR